MKNGIKLSEKYGINPAIPKCFYCGDDKNEIILAGKLPGDQEAPHNAVWDMDPCDQCAKYMEQGVILISCREPRNEEERSNPYRTGGWAVVKAEAIERGIEAGLSPEILKRRFAFVPDEAWHALGLPKIEPQH